MASIEFKDDIGGVFKAEIENMEYFPSIIQHLVIPVFLAAGFHYDTVHDHITVDGGLNETME